MLPNREERKGPRMPSPAQVGEWQRWWPEQRSRPRVASREDPEGRGGAGQPVDPAGDGKKPLLVCHFGSSGGRSGLESSGASVKCPNPHRHSDKKSDSIANRKVAVSSAPPPAHAKTHAQCHVQPGSSIPGFKDAQRSEAGGRGVRRNPREPRTPVRKPWCAERRQAPRRVRRFAITACWLDARKPHVLRGSLPLR